MKEVLVFDWDGTLVSCEEKIYSALEVIFGMYPKAKDEFETALLTGIHPDGWIRKGVLVAKPEDYFTFNFGIIAKVISKDQNLSLDDSWKLVLEIFKNNYTHAQAKCMVSYQKIAHLSRLYDIVVVSNSTTDNVIDEAKKLGLTNFVTDFIGNAKKYNVTSTDSSILGIYSDRGDYKRLLERISEEGRKVTVIGDNFSLDLVTPISMGLRVAYIPNPLTPPEIIHYVNSHQIIYGDLGSIVNELIQQKENGNG
jgi:FMN phosphatase YigB (HAD superfamily)